MATAIPDPAESPDRQVETVTEFTRRVKAVLEEGIRPCWVRGEVSNLLAQASAPNFLATYFPQLAAMRDMFAAISAAAIEAEEYAKRVNNWAATAEDLCCRFGINLKRPGAQFDPC